jgi:serine protease Do
MQAGCSRSLLIGAACATLVFGSARAAAPMSAGNLTQKAQNEVNVPLPSLAPLAERVLPAVVNVSVELNQEAAVEGDQSGQNNLPPSLQGTPFDQFLRRFFEHPMIPRGGAKIVALGSGFIIDPAGYIVTNNHVVENSDNVTVIFQDDSRHKAKVVGRDERSDLALLKIDTKRRLPYVTWGDSAGEKVGDWVVAVGNPFGLGGTVTAGIVSALGRNIGEGVYDNFLQIDAPINRGNSGGPTFNLKGQVIGINTAIYSPSGGSVGIGFAIPSNLARHVVDELREHGHVSWGWLGVEIQSMTPAIARSLGLDPNRPSGALVASVVPGSPAEKAHLQSGDVILEADGHDVKSVGDLPRLVAAMPAGSQLHLTVLRDGKKETVTAAVGEAPSKKKLAAAATKGQGNAAPVAALGMQLAPLTASLRHQLHVATDAKGVVVAEIAEGSPVAALGIEPGDVILSVNRRPVTDPEEAARALKQAARHRNVLLLVNRHGTTEFVGLSIRQSGVSGG